MGHTLTDRLAHAWNAFRDLDKKSTPHYGGYGSSYSPTRRTRSVTNTKSIVMALYNRLAMDVASMNIRHARVDENDSFKDTIDSDLNYVLNDEANIDQSGVAFIQDVAMSLFDEGVVAIVPVDTTFNPANGGGWDIKSMRTGEITEWMPKHVRVRVYNENTGTKEDITLPKSMVGIIENPLYAVMNEPNSTLKRLTNKLILLDAIDEQSGSGKLDIIIQLPYIIKTDAKRKQAEERLKAIEAQLHNSKYGVAYTDGTEKVVQLNRAAENNLMAQVEYLTSMLYSQLGISESVFDGTADEKTMLNYFNRSIERVLAAITDELKRKFLTKTARSQGQSILYFREPFKLVPVSELADIADKFTRNEILSSNEIRGFIGIKPSSDPRADELRNKNLNQKEEKEAPVNLDKGREE